VRPDARGNGVGVRIVEGVMADLEPLRLKRIVLVTEDAHELYRKAGFRELDDPERWMVRPGTP
jgi:N-acetylglutamate synthase-like GNAT family acetyltransferase